MTRPKNRDGATWFNELRDMYWVDFRHLQFGIAASIEAGLDGMDIHELPNGSQEIRELDLRPLHGQTWIRRLDISLAHAKPVLRVVGAESLESLPNLQELYLESFHPDLTKLKHLTHLYLRYPKKQPLLLGPSPYEHITVTHHRDTDLRCFAGCSTLESLAVQRSSLTTLDGLEDLPALKSLIVSHSPKLEDISALAKAKALEKVHFEACKQVRDFSVFEGHPSLKKFFASHVGSLGFVPKVPHLEEVWFWNCEEGDMTPLLQSKSLKRVLYSKNCKHYTHKEAEIQALLAEREKA